MNSGNGTSLRYLFQARESKCLGRALCMTSRYRATSVCETGRIAPCHRTSDNSLPEFSHRRTLNAVPVPTYTEVPCSANGNISRENGKYTAGGSPLMSCPQRTDSRSAVIWFIGCPTAPYRRRVHSAPSISPLVVGT